ncbi:MAG TPA: hypothetical protein DG577_07190 [Firmicutes bacterium]|nr:hypothetical protein [Bacillota bacterium]
MKNSVVKKLGLFVVLIFSVTVVLPVRVFAVNNDQVILESVVRTPDGKIIEKIQFGKVSIEIVTEGTKLVGTITSGNTTELVEADSINPIFTVTTNGEKKTYDRRNFLSSELGHPSEIMANNYDPWYGSPYTHQLCGTKVIGAPHYTTAFAYESYEYHRVKFSLWSFAAQTTIAVIMGVLVGVITTDFNIVLKLIYDAGAAIFGGSSLIDSIIISQSTTEQEWTRHCYINGIEWAYEWRRVKSSLTGVDSSSDDVRELIVHQDWFTTHFFDILDHAIQIFLKG